MHSERERHHSNRSFKSEHAKQIFFQAVLCIFKRSNLTAFNIYVHISYFNFGELFKLKTGLICLWCEILCYFSKKKFFLRNKITLRKRKKLFTQSELSVLVCMAVCLPFYLTKIKKTFFKNGFLLFSTPCR